MTDIWCNVDSVIVRNPSAANVQSHGGCASERLSIDNDVFYGVVRNDQRLHYESSRSPAATHEERVLNTVQMSPATVYRRQILATYINATVPFDFLQPHDLPWLRLFYHIENWPVCLEYAVLAVGLAALGRKAGDSSMVSSSTRYYVHGLRGLRMALTRPELAAQDGVLAAGMLLASYEIVEGPEPSSRVAYIYHHQGCGRLIKFRGPEAHSSGTGHAIFRTYRIEGLLAALQPPHDTFLLERDWLSIPWSGSPKLWLDRVMDLLGSAPAIFRQVQTFQQNMSQVGDLVPTARRVLRQCLELERRMDEFFKGFSNGKTRPFYWPMLSRLKIPDASSVCYEFSDLTTAKILMFYWATLTMLRSGISSLGDMLRSVSRGGGAGVVVDVRGGAEGNQIQDPNPNPDRHPHRHRQRRTSFDLERDDDIVERSRRTTATTTITITTPDPPRRDLDVLVGREHGSHATVDVRTPARNVLQSVEYCLQRDMLGLGPVIAVAPVMMVLETLDRRGGNEFHTECEWARHILRIISTDRLCGLRIM
ncbi:hypothetical protein PV08_02396 [Exophiala spinifera]|uniref:Transcription factor domain-containing protein n=1 Tax=Exophiala spinifera TaxID=91928 RepID=A0A0D2C3C2_9EURO|nr:uncharacterized protein PV08_02396 [Exophiala spinifera]KIW18109.1 hypothetical protein PV08_02396 [Exophiala spinifera]